MISNKRGDLPTVLLVIGTVLVCSLALGSFYLFSIGVEEGFEAIEVGEQVNALAEEISFYLIQGISPEVALSSYFEEPIEIGDDFYFFIESTEEGYKITGEYFRDRWFREDIRIISFSKIVNTDN